MVETISIAAPQTTRARPSRHTAAHATERKTAAALLRSTTRPSADCTTTAADWCVASSNPRPASGPCGTAIAMHRIPATKWVVMLWRCRCSPGPNRPYSERACSLTSSSSAGVQQACAAAQVVSEGRTTAVAATTTTVAAAVARKHTAPRTRASTACSRASRRPPPSHRAHLDASRRTRRTCRSPVAAASPSPQA